MFGRIHHLLPAVAGILGVATVWADAGYLPQTGPVPLRFRPPPPPVVSPAGAQPAPPPPPGRISLPPPPMPVSAPEASLAPPAKPATDAAMTNEPAIQLEAGGSWTNLTSATAPDMVISPQMLIKYFTNSTNAAASAATNAAGAGGVAPFGFIPPPVGTPVSKPPPPSKATLSISP